MRQEYGETYIARRPCGCIVLATAIRLGDAARGAEAIAQAIRDGYLVERVTDEYVRSTPWECEEHKKVKQEMLL